MFRDSDARDPTGVLERSIILGIDHAKQQRQGDMTEETAKAKIRAYVLGSRSLHKEILAVDPLKRGFKLPSDKWSFYCRLVHKVKIISLII